MLAAFTGRLQHDGLSANNNYKQEKSYWAGIIIFNLIEFLGTDIERSDEITFSSIKNKEKFRLYRTSHQVCTLQNTDF